MSTYKLLGIGLSLLLIGILIFGQSPPPTNDQCHYVTPVNKNKPQIFSCTTRIKRPSRVFFTQGLSFNPNNYNEIVETTGLKGDSYINILEASSMKIKRSLKLDNTYFGEGNSVLNGNELYVLTWQNRVCLVYNLDDLTLIATLPIPKVIRQGWGMATNGKVLFITDGSSNLFTVKASIQKLEVISSIRISRESGMLVPNLNEIQYVDGILWANIFLSNEIVTIDIKTGKVKNSIKIPRAMNEESIQNLEKNRYNAVLNGIAYNAEEKSFLITGKLWENVYKCQYS